MTLNRDNLLTEAINPASKNIDCLSTNDLVLLFSSEDKIPQQAVAKALPEIALTIDKVANKLRDSGRLIYIGTGTSGRLGVLDASECPPTFCSSPDLIQGLIAGGDKSLRQSSEDKEDMTSLAIKDLTKINFSSKDTLVGITAGGTTPYVLAAIKYSLQIKALTIAISCVPLDQVNIECDIDIRLITGPEVIAGSTRLKAGTATKMALNMISTGVMIKLGKVLGNRMIDLSTSNIKLKDRSARILSDLASISKERALESLLNSKWSLKIALLIELTGIDYEQALYKLNYHKGQIRKALEEYGIDVNQILKI